MSKYRYIDIGNPKTQSTSWEATVANVKGEIVDTVIYDGTTRGIIVKEHRLQTNG